MQPTDRTKVTTFDDEAHKSIAHGVEVMRKAVGSTYGPGGRNVLIHKPYVDPVLTRDGVTVARDIAGHGRKMPDQISSVAAKLVYQASEKTNKTAGDGTTNTVVLTAELYKAGYRRIVAGEDPMAIKRQIDAARDTIVKFVEGLSQDISDKPEKLEQIAYISSGDKALGAMIADLVGDVGADGSITISYQNAPNVEVEKVTGYLFDRGFSALAVDTELTEPSVLVTQKRLATKADAVPLLELMARTQRQVIIIGDVAGAALETIMWALQNQKVECAILPPPAYGADGHEYFVDIATYTGATLILEGDDFKAVTEQHLGVIKGASISRDKAILFGNNSTGDKIAERIVAIKNQMKSGDITPSLQEQLEKRLAKLAGKVSIIKVGASTEVEREELFFRVEDAVEACKSALSSGIVAGGATTLLHASVMTKEDGKRQVPALEPFIVDALQQPFRLLMSNAGEDGGYRLQQVLNSKYGHGFNLRDMTDEPVDLYKAGIVDATKVILQAVKNSFSVAGALLTTGSVITEVEDETPKSN